MTDQGKAPHPWRPRKGLGQNFLKDPLIAEEIVRASKVKPGDRVVEIGPGFGALTRPLLRQVGALVAVEVDREIIPVLRHTAKDWPGTLTIMDADALTVDFTRLAQEQGGPLRVVANLPYSVSSPLLFHVLHHRQAFSDLTLMLQKEVVSRIVGAPGTKDYGVLSIHIQLWAKVTHLFDVPPESFHPVPKVNSAVLHMSLLPQPLAEVGDPLLFHQLVKAAFGQRRKTLANALSTPLAGRNPATWLEKVGIDPRRRGETLSVAEFATLSRSLMADVRQSP